MLKKIITWDLGATKCAASVVEYNKETKDLQCLSRHTVKLTETHSLENLVQQLESGLNFSMTDADAICVGGAGQYDGETLLLEGAYPYSMCFADTADKLDWPVFTVIHDYAPVVCATFTAYMQDKQNIKHLNQAPINPYGRRVALGIGTGLGLKDGVLFANGDFWLGKNEVGHIGVSTPPNAETHHLQRHEALMRFLHSDSGITFEKILSGQGMLRLHRFFYPDVTVATPEEVGLRLAAGEVPELQETFAWYLGLFLGTVQLIFMPEGGIWITGGVSLNHLDIFDHPALMDGLRVSPAYMLQREQYPLGVLCNHDHALIGGGYYAARRLL